MKLISVLCLCLLTLCGKTSADENGPAGVRVVVKEDRDVILPCSLDTKENIELKLFDWKKAAQKDERQKEVFMYDAGRHYNNGNEGQSEQFKGRVSHFPEELKHGNASITIRNTKVTDSGNYTCDFPRLKPKRQIFHIELVVGHILKKRSVEDIPGDPWFREDTLPVSWRTVLCQVVPTCAARQPSVTTLDQTNEWALLQCEVYGASPEPSVEWQDSSGNKVPAKKPQVSEKGGRYILQTIVTKTDNFSCLVTQETIDHQTRATMYVHLSGAASKPSVTILDFKKDQALLQCEIHGVSPEPSVEWRDGSGNEVPAKEPLVSERGGGYDIILQTIVTKTDNYHCVVRQETVHHQTIHVYIAGSNIGWIVGLVVSLGVIVLLVGVVVIQHIRLNHLKDDKKRRPLDDCSQSEKLQDPETPREL
ncbi:CD276 antigen homolog isoform X3 [Centropristis striata]|uniref:CD276 antigen homolog isoform X3 n=1 Tax=Centropristis striata TaxID=184440 RepID=UPI0027E120A6|nr:CD276 antigen homolog isoform X3 [Centropristis striata]